MVEDERSMRSVANVRHVNEDPEVDHVRSIVNCGTLYFYLAVLVL